MRLLTAYIYSLFDGLPNFKLLYSTDPEVVPEEWNVFTICYNVESIESQVDTFRNQLQYLEKLTYNKPQMLMCKQTDFQDLPLRYFCGVLFVNFQLLWEPVLNIIADHAVGMDLNKFWSIFGSELKKACDYIENPITIDEDLISTEYEFIGDLFQNSQKLQSKPDFVNYRLLLWKALAKFPNVAEAKTRDVSELVLNFIE